MKLFILTIETGVSDEQGHSMIVGSFKATPLATKKEYFQSEEAMKTRMAEIKAAVETIGVCPWLISLKTDVTWAQQ